MSNSVQAKFTCSFKVENKYNSQFVKLYPVGIYNSQNQISDEDRAFWEATPSGSLEMYISNPDTKDFFEENKKYYVTFTPADE